MLAWLKETGEVYQGQFGEFTVNSKDRLGVIIYRAALTIAAIALLLGTVLVLQGRDYPSLESALSLLFALFCSALGVCLWTIHIYLKPLHRALQVCWAIGCITALGVALNQALPTAVYPPYSRELIGVGFVFIALTGLFIKEAFCFNRLQAKLLIFLVPALLSGHWLGYLPLFTEKMLLGSWALIFLWFAIDKDFQSIPPDVGDKSVFEYLKQMNQSEAH